MTLAAVYARQSLEVTEGIDRQLERCAALIAARGWTPGPIYADNGVSATKTRGEGTGWATMLAGIGHDFDVLVAVDLDRLLRTTRDLTTLIEAGARVVTVDGEIDLTSADGEFRATMLAGIARFEVRRKSERAVRANEARVMQGKAVSRPRKRPFGFELDGETHRPDEAAALRLAYDDVLAGASLSSIARAWNAAGFLTSTGKAWTHSSVGHVLVNPRNAGLLAYHREIVGPAEWEGIVTEDVYQATRAVVHTPKLGERAGRSLLGRLGICGICGLPVKADGADGKRVYRCSSRLHLSRGAAPIEHYVAELAIARLEQPDFLDHYAKPEPELVDEAPALRARLDSLATEFADGDLTASQLRTATERIRARLASVEAAQAARVTDSALSRLVGVRDVRAAWEACTVEQQRRVVDTLMTITINAVGRGRRGFDPASVAIDWR